MEEPERRDCSGRWKDEWKDEWIDGRMNLDLGLIFIWHVDQCVVERWDYPRHRA